MVVLSSYCDYLLEQDESSNAVHVDDIVSRVKISNYLVHVNVRFDVYFPITSCYSGDINSKKSRLSYI